MAKPTVFLEPAIAVCPPSLKKINDRHVFDELNFRSMDFKQLGKVPRKFNRVTELWRTALPVPLAYTSKFRDFKVRGKTPFLF